MHLISSNGLFGAEKVLLSLANKNNHDDFIAVVGAIRNSHNPHLEIIEEARKYQLESAVFDCRGIFDLAVVIKIKNFLQKNDFDIIHTHNYKSDIIGFLAAKMAHKKWVATNHVWHGLDFKLRLYESMDAFILRFAHKAVAVSDSIKYDLIRKGLRENKVKIIYNGIDVDAFAKQLPIDDTRKKLGIFTDDLVVAIIGRLSPEKGLFIFLEAVKEIVRKIKNIKFLIIGDGPLKNNLHSAVSAGYLQDRVIFTGIRNDVPMLLSICDILVNSSYIEGLPLTILEAMAAHVLVIGTKVGAIPTVIKHLENGILIEAGDSKGLKEAIIFAIENNEKRKTMVKNAYRDVCDKFSIEKMVSSYSETYKELLN